MSELQGIYFLIYCFSGAFNGFKQKEGIDYVNQRLQSGAFHPLIAEKRFTLDRIVDAYRYMESNKQLGKIVVTV
jgi:NADPH:quinone reductase